VKDPSCVSPLREEVEYQSLEDFFWVKIVFRNGLFLKIFKSRLL
jgi:hypothetical protein